jgi:tetratricopeptide (TPR) repeat protein
MQAYNNIATAYYAITDHANAIKHFRRAIELNPDFADAYSNMSLVHLASENLIEAKTCIDKALSLDSTKASYFNNLAVIFQREENWTYAARNFQKALEIDPSSAETHSNYGNALAQLGQTKDAMASYQKAIQINPHLHSTHYNMGNLFTTLGDEVQAQNAFCHAIDYRQQDGPKTEAEAEARTAAATHASDAPPSLAIYFRSLARARKFEQGDRYLDQMQVLMNTPTVSKSDKIHLCFALGSAAEDLENHKQAFDYYTMGNALMHQDQAYDPGADALLFDQITSIFSDHDSGHDSGGGSDIG